MSCFHIIDLEEFIMYSYISPMSDIYIYICVYINICTHIDRYIDRSKTTISPFIFIFA